MLTTNILWYMTRVQLYKIQEKGKYCEDSFWKKIRMGLNSKTKEYEQTEDERKCVSQIYEWK